VRTECRAIQLNLDTGATNWIAFPAAWVSWLPFVAPPVDGPLLFNNQTGAVRNRIGQLAVDLVVGTHVIRRPVVFLDPGVDDAWLGSALLADSRVELDTRRQRARIHARSELRAPAYRTLGISRGAGRRVRDRRKFRTMSARDDWLSGRLECADTGGVQSLEMPGCNLCTAALTT
jgi:hypothetical protein